MMTTTKRDKKIAEAWSAQWAMDILTRIDAIEKKIDKKNRPVKLGRPRKLDDQAIRALRVRGRWSLQSIAKKYGVSRTAIAQSLKRSGSTS